VRRYRLLGRRAGAASTAPMVMRSSSALVTLILLAPIACCNSSRLAESVSPSASSMRSDRPLPAMTGFDPGRDLGQAGG
jgi:hypothetical protein